MVAALLMAGCSSQPAEQPETVVSSSPRPAPAYDAGAEPAQAVLALVPESATTITVTDWHRIRLQLGQPELTSASPAGDRARFWRRVPTESAAFGQGMLSKDSARYESDYGFGQDDVAWEAHWDGPDGSGYALGFRPDLDLSGVVLASRQGVGPIADGRVQEARRLLVHGTSDVDVWANDPSWAGLVEQPAAATYLHRGCIPLDRALGPDVTAEDRERLLRQHPADLVLRPLDGFAIQFGDHLATVRLSPGRSDLFERLRVGKDWPVDSFGRTWRRPVGDPSTGRIGYLLPDPPEAVSQTIAARLPSAICNEKEPTG